MNYLLAFVFCLIGSVMAELSGYPNTYWLWVSDVNVALHLIIAWLFEKPKS